MEAKKEVAQDHSSAERKELSTQSPINSKNMLQEGKENEDILRRKLREFVTSRLKGWLKETLSRKKRIKEESWNVSKEERT